MILRRPLFEGACAIKNQAAHQSLPLSATTSVFCQPQQRRYLHARVPSTSIPKPTPFVPDATTFLTLIGRGLSTHASKIPSWDALFSLSSPQLKDLGIEPARSRRYLLRWRDKFRNGEMGIGGDAKYVKDGKAEVRVLEVPMAEKRGDKVVGPGATLTQTPGTIKKIVNVDPERLPGPEEAKRMKTIEGLQLKFSHLISGSYVEAVKGTEGRTAVIRVQEGLWEHKRGHKIDGGERRKAMVRAKKRAADRKAGRA